MPLFMYSPTAARLEIPLSRGHDASLPAPAQEEVLRLFDACAPALRRYVRSCGVAPDAAEDVVQEAFLALFRHVSGGGARHNLRGWLVQVSYRLALKHRERVTRRQRREMSWESHLSDLIVDPTEGPEAQVTAHEDRCRLRAVFRALPERDRQCLSLRAEGLRYRDIARTLGISLGTVAKSLTHAVTRLSNAVKE